MTRSALSRTRRRGGEGFDFLFPGGFAFGVASAWPTKARFPILGWKLVPPAMYSISASGGTTIAASNSRTLAGGREPNHKVEDQLHPSGLAGLTLHANRIRSVAYRCTDESTSTINARPACGPRPRWRRSGSFSSPGGPSPASNRGRAAPRCGPPPPASRAAARCPAC